MLKLLKYLIVVTFVIIVACIVLLVMNKNALAKAAVEKALSYVLQVEVTTSRVKLALTGNNVDIYDLRIANPEGYESSEAITAGHVAVALELKSVRSPTIQIERILIEDPRINLEKRKKKLNIRILIDNASRLADDDADAPAQDVAIRKLNVYGGEVKVTMPILSNLVKLKLPDIELENIGTDKSVSVAQAMTIFLKTLLKSTVGVAGKELPLDAFKSLNEGLGFLGGQLGEGKELVDKAKGALLKSKDKLKEEGRDLKQGVKKLFGRD